MLVGFAVTGMFSAIAAFDIGYPATLIAVGISGLTIAPAVASLLLIRREESPPEVRSQVFTVGAALRISTEAIGAARRRHLRRLGRVRSDALRRRGLARVRGRSSLWYPRTGRTHQ